MSNTGIDAAIAAADGERLPASNIARCGRNTRCLVKRKLGGLIEGVPA
jgi:hypothetical protein